jgi:hypothetical protein
MVSRVGQLFRPSAHQPPCVPLLRAGKSEGAYVSIRQHTSAYVSIRVPLLRAGKSQRASASLLSSVTKNTPASVFVSIRQHTSAYVSIRQHTSAESLGVACLECDEEYTCVSIHQHTSVYVRIRLNVSICQHTSEPRRGLSGCVCEANKAPKQ